MSHLRLVLGGGALVAAIAIGIRLHTGRELDAAVERSTSVRSDPVASSGDLEAPDVSPNARRHPSPPIQQPAVEATAAQTAVQADLVELLVELLVERLVEPLVELLGEVARAERARQADRLQTLVGRALSPTHGLAAVLRLLEQRGFDQQAEPFSGALTVAASAAQVESARGENGDLALILARLPFQPENARARLPALLSALDVDGRPVLHAGWWPELLRLQRAHPDLAEDFGPLFGNLHRDAAGLQGLASLLLEAARLVEFPHVVAGAIHGLSVLDPALGASVASQLRERSDLDVELQHELARLSASLLPPSEAVDVLARQPRAIALQGMLVLGERLEAGEALRRKYEDLVLSPGTERDRMNVIAGMRHEGSHVLIDIARTDLSVRVREQAILMLTSSRSVETDTVRALHDLRHAGHDSIGTRSYTSALAHVVVRSGGAARAEALELLRAVVNDATVAEADRLRATELLERHSSEPGENATTRTEPFGRAQAEK